MRCYRDRPAYRLRGTPKGRYVQIGILERGKVGAWSALRRCEVLARKADCITCLYPTESGAATVEAAVMAVEEQAPVGFESKNKRTVFIGSSMTKRNQPTKVVLTMRRKDIRKRKGIRYAEYYNMVEIQDELYRQGMMKKKFYHLMPIIASPQNIRLAYRNLKNNKGSNTPGVDVKTLPYY